jgi:hypothetical protein
MNFEDVMPGERSQTQNHILFDFFCMKFSELENPQNRQVVARKWGRGLGE